MGDYSQSAPLPDFGPRPVYRDRSRVSGETSYQQRRRWRHAESRTREAMRPLRLYVNRLLKNAGVEHGRTYASGRVRGWHHWTAGFETESDIFGHPPGVVVRVHETGSSSLSNRQASLAMTGKVDAVLRSSGLVVERTPSGWKVYPKSWAKSWADEPSDLRSE